MEILAKSMSLFQDSVVLLLFEAGLVSLFLRGLFRDFISRDGWLVVKRGTDSLVKITRFFDLTAPLIIFSIIEISNAYKDYKVILLILNYCMWFYLAHFNSWFRNKVIGFYSKFESHNEKLS